MPKFVEFYQAGTKILVNVANVAYIAPNGEDGGCVLYFAVWAEGEPLYLVVDGTIEGLLERGKLS